MAKRRKSPDVPADTPVVRQDRFRDRILELRRIRCGDLVPHPGNPRTHAAKQLGAITGLLVDVGKARPLIAFPADGLGPKGDFSRLMASDGHGRRIIDPDEVWPVAVCDLTMAEATEMLFADTTGEQAGYDPVLLDAALREVNTGCAELQEMLDGIWSDQQSEAISDAIQDAPEDFPEKDEEIETAYCCPKCGYAWSGATGGEGIDDGQEHNDSSPG